MTNISTKNKILAAVLALVLLACVAGGIFANVQASKERQTYADEMKIVTEYEQNWANIDIDSPIISSFKDVKKNKADAAQLNADIAKATMKKYGIFSAVLIFVAIMMLICIVALLIPKKGLIDSNIAIEKADEPKQITPENDINAIIDNFSIEAPKPSISEKDE